MKKAVSAKAFLILLIGMLTLAIGFICIVYTVPDSSTIDREMLRQELRKLRERYSETANLHGLSSPEARLLERECRILEDLEYRLNTTSSSNQPFQTIGFSLFIVGMVLLGSGFVKVLRR
jgi:hypothetical protein